jgi:hypothetical protein
VEHAVTAFTDPYAPLALFLGANPGSGVLITGAEVDDTIAFNASSEVSAITKVGTSTDIEITIDGAVITAADFAAAFTLTGNGIKGIFITGEPLIGKTATLATGSYYHFYGLTLGENNGTLTADATVSVDTGSTISALKFTVNPGNTDINNLIDVEGATSKLTVIGIAPNYIRLYPPASGVEIATALPELKVGILFLAEGDTVKLTGAAGRLNPEKRTSLFFAAGLRNISAATTIAIEFFPPAAALPALLGIVFQQSMAAIMGKILMGGPRKGGR